MMFFFVTGTMDLFKVILLTFDPMGFITMKPPLGEPETQVSFDILGVVGRLRG